MKRILKSLSILFIALVMVSCSNEAQSITSGSGSGGTQGPSSGSGGDAIQNDIKPIDEEGFTDWSPYGTWKRENTGENDNVISSTLTIDKDTLKISGEVEDYNEYHDQEKLTIDVDLLDEKSIQGLSNKVSINNGYICAKFNKMSSIQDKDSNIYAIVLNFTQGAVEGMEIPEDYDDSDIGEVIIMIGKDANSDALRLCVLYDHHQLPYCNFNDPNKFSEVLRVFQEYEYGSNYTRQTEI